MPALYWLGSFWLQETEDGLNLVSKEIRISCKRGIASHAISSPSSVRRTSWPARLHLRTRGWGSVPAQLMSGVVRQKPGARDQMDKLRVA